MDKPLIINGSELTRSPFNQDSIFFPGNGIKVSNASALDIANAIGSARSANRGSLSARKAFLEEAAHNFVYTQKELEHAVQITGMPIRMVESLFQQIPDIFKEISSSQNTRFTLSRGEDPFLIESLGAGRFKVLQAMEGFCYAVTPGNDPRATALVAANLVFWGIPFILRASPRDAAAALIVRSLLKTGLDSKFCSLVYLDPESPDTPQKHFKLVDASSIVWTFGPPPAIDPTLRYMSRGQRWVIDLEDIVNEYSDIEIAKKALLEKGFASFLERLEVENLQHDHFEEKTILRHEAGNCAALAWGDMNDARMDILYQSIGYAIICTAVKTLLSIDSPGCIEQIADFLPALKTGDPMDPDTQVGYIQPRHLDRLQKLADTNQGKARFYGGRRLSQIQAEPLVVVCDDDLPDFFGQEIQAYVLAVGNCKTIIEASAWLNRHQNPPRLAVILLDPPEKERLKALQLLECRSLLIDKASSTLSGVLHEGNDYGFILNEGRLLIL
jgi:acyl-CoA reductase-like NAD-dependent aldehyde dehydrogenase